MILLKQETLDYQSRFLVCFWLFVLFCGEIGTEGERDSFTNSKQCIITYTGGVLAT